MINWPWKKTSENASEKTLEYIRATLNAPLQPLDRVEYFEEPFDSLLKQAGLGEISGGGTYQEASDGRISKCDLEISASDASDRCLQQIIGLLNSLGAPKKSILSVEGTDIAIEFGVHEGLALYLDGINLDASVYEECGADEVVTGCEDLLGPNGAYRSNWQGTEETIIYFYGPSFDKMHSDIMPFIEAYPLCKGARIVRTA